MIEQLDVLVIGGGPAGVSAAIMLARRGFKVAIIERTRYDRERVGETLPPSVNPLLKELGVWDRFVDEQYTLSPGNVSLWGTNTPYDNDFIFNPYGCGWHIDRRRFDAMLARAAAELGVRFYMAARVSSLRPTPSGWRAEAQCAHAPLGLEASYLIDATGRRTSIARQMGSRKIKFDRLVGVVGFYSTEQQAAKQDPRTLIEATESGWWYSAPLPDTRTIIALMTDSDMLPRGRTKLSEFWKGELLNTSYTKCRLGVRAQSPHLLITSASSYILDATGGERWLSVGDAAAAVDPLSSLGIVSALESGIHAAKAVYDCTERGLSLLRDYDQWVRERFKEFLHSRATYYGVESRWPSATFWRRRQKSRSPVPFLNLLA